ncbi:hypothetical protein Q7C_1292 [Methylophaga frappieri]|jgi:uncharacterized protein YbaR (Trm112 family)|uniref:UPF0434 protein Q7C_1292 n=1 Tax=Methylophaga frappieri (strain ATCC BAA-2434 / DSM 25690 / JAM7) TaxID=754477 RepID=I1YHP9_METFJ|nr:Trm112 family protein [Methylophaga frappieri]AFJ02442.1 hypothetical protein Q7C_1292 [Methylophaga frappieri]
MDETLLAMLVCPVCHGPLTYQKETNELISTTSQLAYPIQDGIPVLLVDAARPLSQDED